MKGSHVREKYSNRKRKQSNAPVHERDGLAALVVGRDLNVRINRHNKKHHIKPPTAISTLRSGESELQSATTAR